MKKFTKLFLVLVLGLAVFLPMQTTNIKALNSISTEEKAVKAIRLYSYNDFQKQYGIYQYRVNELCPLPAVFQWYDNGIPEDIVQWYTPGKIGFIPDRVIDTGYGIVDTGVYFRKFGAKMLDGRTVYFWAHANDKNHLIYG